MLKKERCFELRDVNPAEIYSVNIQHAFKATALSGKKKKIKKEKPKPVAPSL